MTSPCASNFLLNHDELVHPQICSLHLGSIHVMPLHRPDGPTKDPDSNMKRQP